MISTTQNVFHYSLLKMIETDLNQVCFILSEKTSASPGLTSLFIKSRAQNFYHLAPRNGNIRN